MAAIALLGTAGVAFSLVEPSWFGNPGEGDPASTLYPSSMPGILTRNLGSLLLLYSGSCTLGLTSLFSGAAIGGYLGAFVKLEVSATGWEGVLERTGIYSAFEVSGLVLACAAGLVPVVSAVLRPGRTLRDTAARYWAGLTASLDLWCAAALLILVGAIVESIVIST